jgi:hypothetical protein
VRFQADRVNGRMSGGEDPEGPEGQVTAKAIEIDQGTWRPHPLQLLSKENLMALTTSEPTVTPHWGKGWECLRLINDQLPLPEAPDPSNPAHSGQAASPEPAAAYAHTWEAFGDLAAYATDVAERSVLFWDTPRKRADNMLAHERAGKPPLLDFDYEVVLDARRFERPTNYSLLRITRVGDDCLSYCLDTAPRRRLRSPRRPQDWHRRLQARFQGRLDVADLASRLFLGHHPHDRGWLEDPGCLGGTSVRGCIREWAFVPGTDKQRPDRNA